jgi:hypothetical protein
LEDALARSRGIRKARVDVEESGVVSIEVLAAPERSEQSVRREVATLARSILGATTETSLKVLTAARRGQLGGEAPRRKLSSLVTRRTHESFSTQVILSRDGDVVTGESECPSGREDARIVAQAVLAGLDEVSPEPLQLESVETIPLADETLVLVSVMLGQRRLIGSAQVRFDLPDAVARATLHALNRSMSFVRR